MFTASRYAASGGRQLLLAAPQGQGIAVSPPRGGRLGDLARRFQLVELRRVARRRAFRVCSSRRRRTTCSGSPPRTSSDSVAWNERCRARRGPRTIGTAFDSEDVDRVVQDRPVEPLPLGEQPTPLRVLFLGDAEEDELAVFHPVAWSRRARPARAGGSPLTTRRTESAAPSCRESRTATPACRRRCPASVKSGCRSPTLGGAALAGMPLPTADNTSAREKMFERDTAAPRGQDEGTQRVEYTVRRRVVPAISNRMKGES